jgi:hypothetical protein
MSDTRPPRMLSENKGMDAFPIPLFSVFFPLPFRGGAGGGVH